MKKEIETNVKIIEDDTKENKSSLASTFSGNNNTMHECLKEKYKKSPNISDNVKNVDDVDETTKEPELKKLKIEPTSVIDNNENVNTENEKKEPKTVEEYDKENLILQNSLKISIEEDEDISDDAMFLRHERALTEERRKFQTYLKFPWSTRSRANRRIDSRAESSGANTPDPSSPAPQTPSVGGGDLEVCKLFCST